MALKMISKTTSAPKPELSEEYLQKFAQPSVQTKVDPEVSATVEETVQKVLVDPVVHPLEVLTSEYVELYKKFEYFEVKSMVKRMEEIRKILASTANDTMDPKKPAVFVCPDGEVEFSARGVTTDVPDPLHLVQVLLDKFGPEVTATVVDIAITPLRKLLSEHELKDYLVELPGGRTLRAVRPL